MLQEFLFRNQLSAADARQVTLLVIPPVNGEQVLRQGQVDVAVLGDIYRDRALETAAFARCSPATTCSATSPPAAT